CNMLFCPTDLAVQNLSAEGYDNFDCTVVKSGDVMLDGAMFYKQYARKPTIKIEEDFILCTIHRAENTDNEVRLRNIFSALDDISEKSKIVIPIHPRTKKIIESLKLRTDNLILINPVGYLEMIWLIDHSSLIMTDSGGLQKEAFFFKKPCITLRDETEWVELLDNGFNVLAGADKERINEKYNSFTFSNDFSIDIYGNGNASKCIVDELQHEM
ncbi:MAG: UDP-N-acetyl glucosamine 2-epimerase, partial [Candidatus Scalindua sp.]